MAYQKTEIPEGRKNDNYTLTVDADGRVTELLFNDYRPGKQNLDLDIYVMERQTLIKLVKDATARGLIYFERDILAHNVNILNIHALEYTGYVAHVCDMKSYFDENLKLIDEKNLNALFPKKNPVYTRSATTTPPVTSPVPASATLCWLTAASSKAPWRTACCSAASRSRRVPSSRTAS